jgi:hypothetical protein
MGNGNDDGEADGPTISLILLHPMADITTSYEIDLVICL